MNILFTGAGFTKNFGGFLADEMWAIIFNNRLVQRQSKVIKFMRGNFDYESIYHKIINDRPGGEFDDDDKKAIKTAVSTAYKRLDEKILAWNPGTSLIDIFNVSKLIRGFADDRSSMSYFFTLNQDLLIERLFSTLMSSKPLNLPGGIQIKPAPGSSTDRESPLRPEDFITLPNKENVSEIRLTSLPTHEFHYIKLHGSYNWKSYRGHDMMVVGLEKEEEIIKEPLLEWYLDIFKKTLSQDGVRLLIIGYGFRDKHINEIIGRSVKEHALQLYVLSPQEPSEFIESLYLHSGSTIYEGIYGYYPYDFSQVFTADGSLTEEYKMIKDSFFP